MPLYEYQCDACAHRFEVIQKFSDPPVDVCPKCGGAVKKLLSSPAIQFKGSGWYITDYAKKGSDSPAAPAAGDAKAETKTDTKTEAKSETKTETKSESKAD
jgi:putative FmdB family regulatory protein